MTKEEFQPTYYIPVSRSLRLVTMLCKNGSEDTRVYAQIQEKDSENKYAPVTKVIGTAIHQNSNGIYFKIQRCIYYFSELRPLHQVDEL